MSSPSTPEQLIREFIISNFLFQDKEVRISRDDSLLGRGIVDSTGIQELVHFLEVTFSIRVKDEDMIPENLDTVANMVGFINRKKAGV
jgi:acyl carrier protein